MKNFIVHLKKYPLLFFIVCCSSFIVFSGCQKGTPSGKIDDASKPPFLFSASLNQSIVNVDTDVNIIVQDSGKKFLITLFANAIAKDADGGRTIAALHYKIVKPNVGDVVQQGVLTKNSSGGDSASFSDSLTFLVKRVESGLYHVEFYAEDNAHWNSNVMQAPFFIARNNSAPLIDTIFTVDSVHIPANDTISVLFSLAVSDSDGIEDIERVYFRSINSSSPDFPFPMLDDGNQSQVSHDNIAGDGIFSLFIDRKPTSPGYKEFRYFVVDKSGGIDSLSKFIVFYN